MCFWDTLLQSEQLIKNRIIIVHGCAGHMNVTDQVYTLYYSSYLHLFQWCVGNRDIFISFQLCMASRDIITCSHWFMVNWEFFISSNWCMVNGNIFTSSQWSMESREIITWSQWYMVNSDQTIFSTIKLQFLNNLF